MRVDEIWHGQLAHRLNDILCRARVDTDPISLACSLLCSDDLSKEQRLYALRNVLLFASLQRAEQYAALNAAFFGDDANCQKETPNDAVVCVLDEDKPKPLKEFGAPMLPLMERVDAAWRKHLVGDTDESEFDWQHAREVEQALLAVVNARHAHLFDNGYVAALVNSLKLTSRELQMSLHEPGNVDFDAAEESTATRFGFRMRSALLSHVTATAPRWRSDWHAPQWESLHGVLDEARSFVFSHESPRRELLLRTTEAHVVCAEMSKNERTFKLAQLASSLWENSVRVNDMLSVLEYTRADRHMQRKQARRAESSAAFWNTLASYCAEVHESAHATTTLMLRRETLVPEVLLKEARRLQDSSKPSRFNTLRRLSFVAPTDVHGRRRSRRQSAVALSPGQENKAETPRSKTKTRRSFMQIAFGGGSAAGSSAGEMELVPRRILQEVPEDRHRVDLQSEEEAGTAGNRDSKDKNKDSKDKDSKDKDKDSKDEDEDRRRVNVDVVIGDLLVNANKGYSLQLVAFATEATNTLACVRVTEAMRFVCLPLALRQDAFRHARVALVLMAGDEEIARRELDLLALLESPFLPSFVNFYHHDVLEGRVFVSALASDFGQLRSSLPAPQNCALSRADAERVSARSMSHCFALCCDVAGVDVELPISCDEVQVRVSFGAVSQAVRCRRDTDSSGMFLTPALQSRLAPLLIRSNHDWRALPDIALTVSYKNNLGGDTPSGDSTVTATARVPARRVFAHLVSVEAKPFFVELDRMAILCRLHVRRVAHNKQHAVSKQANQNEGAAVWLSPPRGVSLHSSDGGGNNKRNNNSNNNNSSCSGRAPQGVLSLVRQSVKSTPAASLPNAELMGLASRLRRPKPIDTCACSFVCATARVVALQYVSPRSDEVIPLEECFLRMRVGGESTKTRTLRKLDTKKQGDVLELHTDLVLPRVPVCDDAPVDIVLQLCRRTDTRAGRLVSKLRRQERAFKVLSWTRLRSNRTGACWHDMNVEEGSPVQVCVGVSALRLQQE